MKRLLIFLLCLNLPSNGAISLVQKNFSGSGSSNTLNVTLPGATTNGNLILAAIVTSVSTTSVTSVTDTTSTTFTRRSGRTFLAGTGGCEIWSGITTGGSSYSVTANYSATISNDLHVLEYTGNQATPFDVQASATGSSTTPSSGNATTTVANELLLGYINYNGGGTITAGTGFTIQQNGNQFFAAVEDQLVSSTGTYAATATLSVSGSWNACFATFKAAPRGPKHRIISWVRQILRLPEWWGVNS